MYNIVALPSCFFRWKFPESLQVYLIHFFLEKKVECNGPNVLFLVVQNFEGEARISFGKFEGELFHVFFWEVFGEGDSEHSLSRLFRKFFQTSCMFLISLRFSSKRSRNFFLEHLFKLPTVAYSCGIEMEKLPWSISESVRSRASRNWSVLMFFGFRTLKWLI